MTKGAKEKEALSKAAFCMDAELVEAVI